MRIKLDDFAIMPERAHPADAGLDLISPIDCTVFPMQKTGISTGIHLEIPEGFVGIIKSRSGLFSNSGIITTGTIDSGYTGSIKVVLLNTSGQPHVIRKGDKIAQLVILRCFSFPLEVVDNLPETERGDNGFGSTGR